MLTFLLNILFAGALCSNSHDVTTLGEWGPYGKQYAGISHIGDLSSGMRFDFCVVPGFYRRTYMIPSLIYESGCYPWKVNADMTKITYRYELEWKDRVYVDATYYVADSSHVLLGLRCVNHTELPQNLSLQGVSSMHYAEDAPSKTVSGASFCLPARDYVSYEPAQKLYNYHLVYDGWLRGEKRTADSLFGGVIETSGQAGDCLEYELPAGDHSLNLYACIEKNCKVRVSFNGSEIEMLGTGEYSMYPIGTYSGKLVVQTLSEGKARLDSFLEGDSLSVLPKQRHFRPEQTGGTDEYILKYEDAPDFYGFAWNFPVSEIRLFDNSDLDVFMKKAVHQHPPKYFRGDRNGFFTSAFLRPVFLQPQSDTTIWCMLSKGKKEDVEAVLASFHSRENDEVARCLAVVKDEPVDDVLPEAKKYEQPYQLFKAILRTNVVYPVYTQNQYIRHFTPGKIWNSLYTWDLGFISWAFAVLDSPKAFETIRAYTTEESSQSAFIHHGTPLPTQFFAFEQFCSESWDDEAIRFLYPRLKRYYDFVVGKDPTSTCMMHSGFVRTWDYWYSTGGWDDYPAQHYLRQNKQLYPSVAPMVSSAYYIRAAKILRMIAKHYGWKKDERQYDRDIQMMSSPILQYGWDDECGYFAYVTHDASGKPDGFLKAPDGSNYNKGLDGIAPYAASICNERQRDRMDENMFTQGRLWSPYGMAVVDQSASYYSDDGYSVGASWTPHQLVFWKTMLDYNKPERALQIARAVMDVWALESDATYGSYENIRISTGRASGWNSFSGLSSPVVNWYKSYFCKGTISTGFDAVVTKKAFAKDHSECEFTLEFDKDAVGRDMAVLLCLNPDCRYTARSGKQWLPIDSPYPGLVCLTVKGSLKPLVVSVTASR